MNANDVILTVELEASRIHPSQRNRFVLLLNPESYTAYVLARMSNKFLPVIMAGGVRIRLDDNPDAPTVRTILHEP